MTQGHTRTAGAGDQREHCAAHGHAAEELRALAEVVVERLGPWTEQLRQAGSLGSEPGRVGADGTPSCTWCPLCAVLDLLRGQHPELAARLSEHSLGLLAAVREALAAIPGPAQRSPQTSAGAEHTEPQADPTRGFGAANRVQRVPVRRDARQPGASG